MRARELLLPVLSAGLVAAVLGVQLAQDGGDFVPTRTADPCLQRDVTPVSGGIDGLAEALVLLGLDGAACQLGTSREGLVLELADDRERTDVEVEALRAGLLAAVDRLSAQDRLPAVSALAGQALESADLPGLVKTAIRALPDALVDNRLATDDVLRRAITDLDLRRLLDSIGDPSAIEDLINDSVTEAVKDELLAGLPNPFD